VPTVIMQVMSTHPSLKPLVQAEQFMDSFAAAFITPQVGCVATNSAASTV
jgi:hypothetical protein